MEDEQILAWLKKRKPKKCPAAFTPALVRHNIKKQREWDALQSHEKSAASLGIRPSRKPSHKGGYTSFMRKLKSLRSASL